MHDASAANPARANKKANPIRPELERLGLYHSFQLPDGRQLTGVNSLEVLQQRVANFDLPPSLAGKSVLDVGPWDGFFTFELERRGADVTAVDYVDLDSFRLLHRAFSSRARYLQMEVYELDPQRLGEFDIVLCLGVLYHLQHPLLALEKVCAVTRDVCFIDTYVIDTEVPREDQVPAAEFYPHDELAGQLDNWCGPNIANVRAWALTAGFATCDLIELVGHSARFRASRRWRHLPPDSGLPPLAISGITGHNRAGRSFRSAREEYLSLWFDPQVAGPFYVEIDSLAAPILHVEPTHVTLRLPPGLVPGEHHARIRAASTAWSEPTSFYVDLPDLPSLAIEIGPVQDGQTWECGVVSWQSSGGWITLWASGLSPEADPANVIIDIDGIPHPPYTVDPGTGQINIRLRPVLTTGVKPVALRHRGAVSNSITFELRGEPPAVRGLS